MVFLVNDPLAPEFLGKVIPRLGETLEEDLREEQAWIKRISKRSMELAATVRNASSLGGEP